MQNYTLNWGLPLLNLFKITFEIICILCYNIHREIFDKYWFIKVVLFKIYNIADLFNTKFDLDYYIFAEFNLLYLFLSGQGRLVSFLCLFISRGNG